MSNTGTGDECWHQDNCQCWCYVIFIFGSWANCVTYYRVVKFQEEFEHGACWD